MPSMHQVRSEDRAEPARRNPGGARRSSHSRKMGALAADPEPGTPISGKVCLVGAGPGDPDLLTVRALDLLRQADLVLYDNLASPEVVSLAAPGAEIRYVGKKRSEHAFTQDEINAQMAAGAVDGKLVVRLKGGDPYVFGRGGEEAQALARVGVPFEVVPGVSSALGAAAYAGLPLTHRSHTQALTMVTGHDARGVDWAALARRQTLVIFMGLVSLPKIVDRLKKHGLSPDTPAAAVRWATRGDQRVITATLDNISAEVRRCGLLPPALVVIGDIVTLRDEVDWFERLPLRGHSVAVTRAAGQAGPFCRLLRHLGALVLPMPVIDFRAPSSWSAVDRAIACLPAYDWLLFTSVNGVTHFLERLERSGRDLRDLPRRIGAIGPATAQRLRALHLRVDLMPDQFVAESLSRALKGQGLCRARVLLPRAEHAREVLPRDLRRMGAEVDVAPVYRTFLPESSRQLARKYWVEQAPPRWVTLTSSSTARNLAQLVQPERLSQTAVASIGPITSATAREHGMRVAVEARTFTTEGLARALCDAAGHSPQ